MKLISFVYQVIGCFISQVHWSKGVLENGMDSIAKQIVPASHWPEMRVIILVVNNEKKKYSSTSGMKTSVETSQLLKHRAEVVVPQRICTMIEAIKSRDFETFADITMRDSNQMHAVTLDTYPPCVYMNDVSHAIADLVHTYNQIKSSNKVGIKHTSDVFISYDKNMLNMLHCDTSWLQIRLLPGCMQIHLCGTRGARHNIVMLHS